MTVGLIIPVLVACSPSAFFSSDDTSQPVTMQDQIQQSQEAQEQNQAPQLWADTVSGLERWADVYRGELGNAVMQDGEFVTLELSNRVISGADLLFPSLPSRPMRIRYSTTLGVPLASVLIGPKRLIDGDPASFTGPPTLVNVRVEGDRLKGELSFELENDNGAQLVLQIYDLDVPIRR